ncbi:MAG: restriction endonuclease subunit S [Phycisphaeraceae bacterium]
MMESLWSTRPRPDWAVTTLGQLGDWSGGSTPSKSRAEFWTNGTIPWISPKDMKALRLRDSEDHITEAAVDGRPRLVPTGSVLFVIRSGILSRTFPVAINEVDTAINQDLKALHPHEKVDPAFIAYFVRSAERRLLNQCSKDGTTVASINLAALKAAEFPLVPLVEQRAIVEKIEALFSELDKGVEQLQAVRAQLKRYRQAVLKAAFEGKLTADWRDQQEHLPTADDLLQQIQTERAARYQQQHEDWEKAVAHWEAAGGKASGQKKPRKPAKPKELPPLSDTERTNLPNLPEGWGWVKTGHVIEFVTSGSRGWARFCGGKGPLFIRSQDIRTDALDLSDATRLDLPKGLEGDRTRVHTNDLLLTITGANVGRCAIVGQAKEEAYVSQHVALIRLVDPNFAPFWHRALISRAVARGQLLEYAYGAGKPGLNLDNVRDGLVPLPSREEQQRIVDELESRFTVLDKLEQAVDEGSKQAEALRQSILKKAFEGRLLSEAELAAVRADPDYEPADQLLERIRAEREQRDAAKPTRGRKLKAAAPTRRIKLPAGERYRQAAFAAYAVNRLADRQTFGRTQLMKYLYLVPHLLEAESHIYAQRKAAGPLDPAIHKIESLAKRKGWFVVQKSGQRYSYRRGTSIDAAREHAVKHMGPGQVRVDWLLDQFAKMDTQQAELVATTFAVWNDHLIDGVQPTQKQIITGVHDWHPDKAEKFPPQRIRDCIKWIKDHDLVPTGIEPKTQPGSAA